MKNLNSEEINEVSAGFFQELGTLGGFILGGMLGNAADRGEILTVLSGSVLGGSAGYAVGGFMDWFIRGVFGPGNKKCNCDC